MSTNTVSDTSTSFTTTNPPIVTSQFPNATLLGSYGSYAEAQRVVDLLSDRGFPVHKVSILTRNLALTEKVTGRRTWGSVIIGGIGSGALTGLFIGLLFGLFAINGVDWLNTLMIATLAGVVVGVVFGLLGYAATKGTRDFDSISTLTADRFEVYVENDVVAEAKRIVV